MGNYIDRVSIKTCKYCGDQAHWKYAFKDMSLWICGECGATTEKNIKERIPNAEIPHERRNL